jgi:serine/threonine-protein kinase PknG
MEETGFCDTCGRRPLPVPPAYGTTRPVTVPDSAVRLSLADGDSELFSLPVFEFPDPSSRVLSNLEIPERARRCAACKGEVGRSYAGQPAPSEGYCPTCGRRYSFLPSLHAGDLVGGQYKVVGCFARGGLGWVYLARDTNLDDNFVVLKGLINTGDATLAEAERRALTTLDHPNIVRIYNFVTHTAARGGEPRDYIVMEYVDGLVLSDVQKLAAAGGTPLGAPLRVEHVIVCGLQILAAFDYLHRRGLLYCDTKPDNVIIRSGQHGERVNRVKLVDLGAVRRADDRDSRIIGTPGYQVSQAEIDDHGLSIRSDLRTLGVTLDRLFQVTVDRADQRAGGSPVALGLESFRLLLERAVREEPERRFTSAAEMADQLQGVYREIAALRDGKARPKPSAVFAPTAALLDAGLGAVPPLERWTRCPAGCPGNLADRRPAPAAVAMALPVPRGDPEDPATGFLAAADAPDPRRLLAMLAAFEQGSVEVELARCRAYLELGAVDAATVSAKRAGRLLAGAAGHDWRVSWYDGLLALGRGDVAAAWTRFDVVYRDLPGEEAPKLALGYCAECTGKPARAEELYQAVWHRDRLQASAAFGLVRLRLADGDRAGAVALLASVPKVSRHSNAAAIARVLVLSGRLSSGPPSADDLSAAADRLPELYLDGGDHTGDARDRLTAVLREAALAWTQDNAGPLPADGGAVFGDRPDQTTLRRLLEQSYQALAGQARDADTHAALLDRANAVRPVTLL